MNTNRRKDLIIKFKNEVEFQLIYTTYAYLICKDLSVVYYRLNPKMFNGFKIELEYIKSFLETLLVIHENMSELEVMLYNLKNTLDSAKFNDGDMITELIKTKIVILELLGVGI